MPILTDEEADALDEYFTKNVPDVDTSVQGPFIKARNRVVVLDQLSADYLNAKMHATKLSPAEQIHRMIRAEMEREPANA